MRNILITGASSGIGAAMAQAYAAPEAVLLLHGRDENRLSKTAAACRERGALVHTALIPVGDRAAMKRWIEDADDRHPLDLVIANAGISGGTSGNIAQGGLDGDHLIFETNLMGVLNTIGPVIPRMIARKRGQVALMSSLAGFSGWPGAPAYSASKAAVRYYGEALRPALAPHNVCVSVICPGFIATPMTDVNPFPMPFLMKANEAAALIVAGLAAGRGRIAFPWPTYTFVRFVGILPPKLREKLTKSAPSKPRRA